MIIEHNVKAILDLGFIKIHFYGIIYALAFFVVYFISKDRIKKLNLSLSDNNLMSLLGLMFFSSIIFARLGYVFIYWGKEYLRNPLEIFRIWEGGLSYHGGMIGAILALFIYTKFAKNQKVSFLTYADLISFSLPLAIFMGKIGHFFNGELLGRPTNYSWGVLFLESAEIPVSRHPVQIYEALFEGILVFIALYILSKTAKKGQIFALFLLLSGLMRFITEFFREPDPQIGYILKDFTLGQLLSIPVILSGVFIYQYINAKKLT